MAELNNLAEVGELGMDPLTPTTVPTPVEQAAIVLLSMGEEPAAAVLRCLTREELLEITQVMSRLSGIKVDSVKHSLQHFFDDYREQSGVHGASRAFLKRSLDMALGSEIANSVLNSIYGDAIRPKMSRLQWASPKWLADRIAHEHVRMQAVFIAFLPASLAGHVIDALPAEGRDLLLLNVARLKEIDRDLLEELDDVVTRCLDSLSMQSATVEGIKQAGEIINRLPGNKQQMVELLRAHDPAVASEIGAGAVGLTLDVRDADACAEIVRAGVELGGRIGVWVNNAGVLATEPAWQTSAETRRLIMEVNALGTMNGSLAALESMHATGGGHIVNIASMAALVAVPGEAVYAASKHASIGFTLSLAADLQIAGAPT